ncbi:molybdate ABC transporter substrate-binding protein [Okibacterium endophyticum]
MRRPRLLAVAAASALLLTGCSGPGGQDSPHDDEVTIFAAASLAGAFDDVIAAFIEAHPGTDVAPLVSDGSTVLAAQLREGASADVVALADERSLTPLIDDGLVAQSTVFATNTMRIAVARGNPLGVDSLEDLAEPGLKVVLCAAEVPCGAASVALLERAGADLSAVSAVSEETAVTAVANKVRLGEADAGLVYATDIVASGGSIDGVVPEGADAVVNSYPIATLGERPGAGAQEFVDFVLSETGQRILAGHGFGAP